VHALECCMFAHAHKFVLLCCNAAHDRMHMCGRHVHELRMHMHQACALYGVWYGTLFTVRTVIL